jgi:hypothetical protein
MASRYFDTERNFKAILEKIGWPSDPGLDSYLSFPNPLHEIWNSPCDPIFLETFARHLGVERTYTDSMQEAYMNETAFCEKPDAEKVRSEMRKILPESVLMDYAAKALAATTAPAVTPRYYATGVFPNG